MSGSARFDDPAVISIQRLLGEAHVSPDLSPILARMLSGQPDSAKAVIQHCFCRIHDRIEFDKSVLSSAAILHLGSGASWLMTLSEAISRPRTFFGQNCEILRDYGITFLHNAAISTFQSAIVHDANGSAAYAGLPSMIPQLVLLEGWAEVYPRGIRMFGPEDALGNSIKTWARDAQRNGQAHLEERKRDIDQALKLLSNRLFPETGEPPVLTEFGEQILRLVQYGRFGSMNGRELLQLVYSPGIATA